ncbi:MAG TPA: DUF4166 domain-containing protein [Streptosporangiaceae bacterium]
MTSIFQRSLGRDFARLHPALQRRFGIGAADGEACIGTGHMDEIWHGAPFVRPFLALGGRRNILFPETGRGIPFTIENYPYIDTYGRETVTFVRTFQLAHRTRRFDATMVFSPERGCVVDYLGTHQHIGTDLFFAVDERGGLVIRSGEHRLFEGPVRCRLPPLVTGTAEVHESYDDHLARFRIRVEVTNRRFGRLFGYRGSFTARYVSVAGTGVPASVRPRREQARR